MQLSLHNKNAKYLTYGIREVVEVAQKIQELDPDFIFIGENIGDPIAKGWDVPNFVKEILSEIILSKGINSFGYAHSRGVPETREWVASYSRRFAPSSRLTAEEVLFVNGLGAGINVLYRMLPKNVRVLQPSPCYPAHSSTEAFYAGSKPIFYRLDPKTGWQPDIEHVEWQLKSHKEIAGILLINPGNPTGGVISKEVLEELVKIAEKRKKIIISDEVYFRLVFNGARYAHITELAANRVPLIVLRGASKDIPWPGSRCGWLEFHNLELDQNFKDYFENVKKPLLLEVCATILPQLAIPKIYNHPKFDEWLNFYKNKLEDTSNTICDLLNKVQKLKANRINGAFYIMNIFERSALSRKQQLPIKNAKVKKFVEELTQKKSLPLDKRFAYYLLASTGICVVPATDFEADFMGFRVTSLEYSKDKLIATYNKLATAISEYLAS